MWISKVHCLMNQFWNSPVISNAFCKIVAFHFEECRNTSSSIIFHDHMRQNCRVCCDRIFWNYFSRLTMIILSILIYNEYHSRYCNLTITSDDNSSFPEIFDLFDRLSRVWYDFGVLNCVWIESVPRKASSIVDSFFEFLFQRDTEYSCTLFEIGLSKLMTVQLNDDTLICHSQTKDWLNSQQPLIYIPCHLE